MLNSEVLTSAFADQMFNILFSILSTE